MNLLSYIYSTQLKFKQSSDYKLSKWLNNFSSPKILKIIEDPFGVAEILRKKLTDLCVSAL